MATVSAPTPTPARVAPPRKPPVKTAPRDSWRTWPIRDQIGLALCWSAGIFFCVVAAAVVLFMLYKGVTQLSLDLLFTSPEASICCHFPPRRTDTWRSARRSSDRTARSTWNR